MANLITRRAARHRGNLVVPIKRSAAAQSNYGETGGPVTGTGWGLSPFLGQGRDQGGMSPSEHLPPALPAFAGSPFLLAAVPGKQMRGKAGALPQVHPSAFFPCECPFADAWSICSSENKTLPEAKRFAGACGTGLSVGALSGQHHPHGPLPGSVTQKA